jgi:hypothetical protein
MPAIDIIRYIVVQKLVGNEKALCILRNYVNGLSPSIIIDICNATRYEIVGYLQRIRERSGNLYRGYVVAKHILKFIDAIPTLTNSSMNDGRCPFCGRFSSNLVFHIEKKHRDKIQKYIDMIIEILMDKVNNGKKIENI